MRKKILLFILEVFLLTSIVCAQQRLKVIKAGRLIDVVAGKILTNQLIFIDGDTIVNIGASLSIPSGAEIIDLGNATVLPGLVDCHTHLTGEPSDDYYGDIFRKTPIDNAIIAAVYAKRT